MVSLEHGEHLGKVLGVRCEVGARHNCMFRNTHALCAKSIRPTLVCISYYATELYISIRIMAVRGNDKTISSRLRSEGHRSIVGLRRLATGAEGAPKNWPRGALRCGKCEREI